MSPISVVRGVIRQLATNFGSSGRERPRDNANTFTAGTERQSVTHHIDPRQKRSPIIPGVTSCLDNHKGGPLAARWAAEHRKRIECFV
jgi:hypothetical protein